MYVNIHTYIHTYIHAYIHMQTFDSGEEHFLTYIHMHAEIGLRRGTLSSRGKNVEREDATSGKPHG
jgi:hypothetical protein